jgi:hypothetical protein
VYIYKVFLNFSVYGDVSVIRVCLVASNGRTCVFLGEIGYSELLFFSMNVDAMRVYVVGAVLFMSSVLYDVPWEASGHVLISCFTILVSFCILEFC